MFHLNMIIILLSLSVFLTYMEVGGDTITFKLTCKFRLKTKPKINTNPDPVVSQVCLECRKFSWSGVDKRGPIV